jgi:DNA replication protein
MPPFSGFPDGKVRLTPIPASFFTELLPAIDHLGELKVTLYAIWHIDHQEGNLRYITTRDFISDTKFISSLGNDAETVLADSIERAVLRGTFLKLCQKGSRPDGTVYFLNSPRGRSSLSGLELGNLILDIENRPSIALEFEQPTIFRLYEENIGPLTPMICDILREAESQFPSGWIEEALALAVKKNVRNWRYIDAILRSWQEKGRYETDRRDSEKNRRRYIEGEYADLIEH